MNRYLLLLSLSFALLVSLGVPLAVLAETGAEAADAFYPLTNLPGLSDTLSSDTLPRFLNNLYRLCIGAVAVIAVLKIMQGGAMLMFNRGSFSQATEAKKHIQNAVLGLILVLSPAIVFGIINPDILNLTLNVEELSTNYSDVAGSEGQRDRTMTNAVATCLTNLTPEQRSCASAAAQQALDESTGCRFSYDEDNTGGFYDAGVCLRQRFSTMRSSLRGCAPNITEDQYSCINREVLPGLGYNEESARELVNRNTYTGFHTVREGTSCPENEEKVPRQWCSDTRGGLECCGRKASRQYLLAYHYDVYRRNESTGAQGARICRQKFVRGYADQAECARSVPNPEEPIPNASNRSYSRPTILKRCEQIQVIGVDSPSLAPPLIATYNFPPPPNGVQYCP
jgi:hypothetical protein